MKKILSLVALMMLCIMGANAETVKYALSEGDTFTSGQTVEVKNAAGDVVATLTYGESGGDDFKTAKAATNIDGYTAFTEGNGVNGNKTGGTWYTITPKVDAKIAVAVVLNADKAFYIEEDGTALSDYNGIKVSEKFYGTYEFDAKAGKAYKFYCAGSKLGFFGFEMTIGGEEPIIGAPVYYLVGTMTGWDESNETYKLTANEANADEYMIQGVEFEAKAAFKVIGHVGDVLSWYPDAENSNYVINEAGKYDVYFRPDGKGGDGWHYGYIYASKQSEEPVKNTYTATFTTNKGWEKVFAYAWFVPADGTAVAQVTGNWPGLDITETKDDKGVYTFSIESPVEPSFIIFSDGTDANKTEDLVFENGKAYEFNNVGPVEPEYIYAVVGKGGIFATEWDEANAPDQMTLDEASGLYTWTKKNANLEPQTIEFKVIKKAVNVNEVTKWYPENNQIIEIPEAGYYTITVTFNAGTEEVAFTSAMRETPIYPKNNVYYWESPDGIENQNGGKAVHVGAKIVDNPVSRVNYEQAGFYTICLNGKKANVNDEANTSDENPSRIVITLDNALEEGDVIDMTAFINKDASKKSSAYFVFENGTAMEGEVYSDEANIHSKFNGSPKTTTYTVSEAAAGSKTITLTRSQTGTNLFITKLTITRPQDTSSPYYLVGNMTGWAPKEDFRLTKNTEAETEEYMIKGVALTTESQFKIAKSEDGAKINDTDWYPGGMDNNYGEHGEIKADGTYNIYFRPDGNGGDDWFYSVIYVVSSLTDGINTVSTAAQNAVIFNMAGQRVMNAQKGLYIINGKKVVIK